MALIIILVIIYLLVCWNDSKNIVSPKSKVYKKNLFTKSTICPTCQSDMIIEDYSNGTENFKVWHCLNSECNIRVKVKPTQEENKVLKEDIQK